MSHYTNPSNPHQVESAPVRPANGYTNGHANGHKKAGLQLFSGAPSASSWERVSAKSPCPICENDSWCAVSSDGGVCQCMRVAEGSWATKKNSVGETYHLHRLQDSLGFLLRDPRPRQSAKPRLDPAGRETLDAVYSALLDLPELALSKKHRQALHARGLDDATIDAIGYRSFPDRKNEAVATKMVGQFGKDVTLRVPGFFVNASGRLSMGVSAGLLIPSLAVDGKIQAIKVRPDSSLSSAKYHYLSSTKHDGPGPGSPVHVPKNNGAPPKAIRLTEGEIKADIATRLTGMLTLSMPGHGRWSGCVVIAKDLGAETVRLAFDRDAYTNPAVARSFVECYESSVASGFAVQVERWDDHKGIDDALAADKEIRVLEGEDAVAAVAEARAVYSENPEPDPEDESPDDIAHRSQEIDIEILIGDVLDRVTTEGIAEFYGDLEMVARVAALEVVAPGKFASLVDRLKHDREIGFSASLFKTAMEPHRKAARKFRASVSAGTDKYQYMDNGDSISVKMLTAEGDEVVETLSRFSARIETAISYDDDDGEQRKFLKIVATIQDVPGKREVEVPADQYEAMSWAVGKLGPGAVITPGRQNKDLLRHAIQELSLPIPEQTVFRHTGWRDFDGVKKYLHGGGAIGPDGPDLAVSVDLTRELPKFRLPHPPIGEARRKAILSSLGILRLGQTHRPGAMAVAAAMISAPYRAAIRPANFSLQVHGATGSLKSSTSALAQQHFGAEMNAQALPASWKATEGSLGRTMHLAASAILVVDDLVPQGSARTLDSLINKVDSVFRGQGNNSGRGRLNPDGTSQAVHTPRGLVISTGEDIARIQSANHRTLPLHCVKEDVGKGVVGTIDPVVLSGCQADANSGLYAASMAAYIQWLAPQYESVCDRLTKRCLELRSVFAKPGDHGRLPDLLSDLMAGFEFFLEFAIEAGAVNSDEAERHREAVFDGLTEAADAVRDDRQEEQDPAETFTTLIAAALTSGRYYLADTKGKEVQEDIRAACGWRLTTKYQGNEVGQVPEWEPGPNAERIGWTDGEKVYLDPSLSYHVVSKLSEAQGQVFPLAKQGLWKLLHTQKKIAVAADSRNKKEGRNRLAARFMLEGQRRDVIVLRASEFWPDTDEDDVDTGDEPQEGAY